jgi:osmotically-inducible protein OsmY
MAVNQVRKMSPQDESVWFKVRIALKVNPETEPIYKEIKINADRGVVTLEGNVASEEVARSAERAALGVQDVINVINNLKF